MQKILVLYTLYILYMKSSLESYPKDPALVDELIAKINLKNSSEEKLPSIRKPFKFNASYAKVLKI
jgi:hypothetical protein